jgi:hypothetical protein
MTDCKNLSDEELIDEYSKLNNEYSSFYNKQMAVKIL